MSARTDTERLDWLEKHGHLPMFWGSQNGWTIAYLDSDGFDDAGRGDTIRAAIDDGMSRPERTP